MRPMKRPDIGSVFRLPGPLAKNAIWRAAYRRWPEPPAEPSPGYTVLMPVPGDLPVFARVAIANVAAQDPAGRQEILVIPDRPSPTIAAASDAARAEWGVRGLRLVNLTPGSRAMTRIARGDPGANHFVQLHAGIAACTTTHALLHDADLFVIDARFLARHHRQCAEQGLAFVGIAPIWDDWLRVHGLGHVVATPELMFDVAWMRSFRPWRHRAHFAWVDGEWHGFDTTVYPQARTAPSLCGIHPRAEESVVHFNWVISVYRHFQRSGGQPIEDGNFGMLLIRLLVDALESRSGGGYSAPIDVPAADELARGLDDPSRRVTYRGAGPAGNYSAFRAKVRRLYRAPLFDDAAIEAIEQRLAPFDAALS